MSALQIRIGGEAGQGVILAGVVLAEAAAADGRHVAQSARYGAAVRGGEATADVVVADGPIDFPHVERPDQLVALSQPIWNRLMPTQAPGTLVIYDPFFVQPDNPPEGVRLVRIPATERAITAFGKATAANLVVLGALVELGGAVSRESLEHAAAGSVSPRFREANMKALAMGRELATAAGGPA
jgi:2-oxoglutarate ferredoxin oxidoreductase subunit gamma